MRNTVVIAGLVLMLALFMGLSSLNAQQQGAGQQGGRNCPMVAKAESMAQQGWFCPTGGPRGMGRGMMGKGCPMRAPNNPPAADQSQSKPAPKGPAR
jgi:hypothetical protein